MSEGNEPLKRKVNYPTLKGLSYQGIQYLVREVKVVTLNGQPFYDDEFATLLMLGQQDTNERRENPEKEWVVLVDQNDLSDRLVAAGLAVEVKGEWDKKSPLILNSELSGMVQRMIREVGNAVKEG